MAAKSPGAVRRQLWQAVSRGSTEAVADLVGKVPSLVAQVASEERQPSNGSGIRTTLVHRVAELDLPEIMVLLLDKAGALANPIQDDTCSPLHVAARSGSYGCAKALCQHRADVAALDGDGRTPLHVAVAYAREGVVMVLLDAGADVEAMTWSLYDRPLPLALRHNQIDIAAILIGRGADINARDRYGVLNMTALHWVAKLGCQPLLRILVEYGSELEARNEWEETPFLLAAREGHVGCMAMLESAGASITPLDHQGASALVHAARGGHLRAMEWLLGRGHDASQCTSNGESVLHWCVKTDQVDAAELLLTWGADPAQLDYSHRGIFHLAARCNAIRCLELLCHYGTDVDTRSIGGRTALHLTAAHGFVTATELLLRFGADPHACDGKGKRPRDAAWEKGHTKLATAIAQWSSTPAAACATLNSARSASSSMQVMEASPRASSPSPSAAMRRRHHPGPGMRPNASRASLALATYGSRRSLATTRRRSVTVSPVAASRRQSIAAVSAARAAEVRRRSVSTAPAGGRRHRRMSTQSRASPDDMFARRRSVRGSRPSSSLSQRQPQPPPQQPHPQRERRSSRQSPDTQTRASSSADSASATTAAAATSLPSSRPSSSNSLKRASSTLSDTLSERGSRPRSVTLARAAEDIVIPDPSASVLRQPSSPPASSAIAPGSDALAIALGSEAAEQRRETLDGARALLQRLAHRRVSQDAGIAAFLPGRPRASTVSLPPSLAPAVSEHDDGDPSLPRKAISGGKRGKRRKRRGTVSASRSPRRQHRVRQM